MNRFAHLHTHTDHSLLDGMIKAEALMERCRDNGMTSVAVTDHGTLSGIWEMQKAAQKFGVNYVPGVEAYVVPDVANCRGKDWSNKGKSRHLVILAQDQTGYKNLVTLMSKANLEGFYTQPRIDHRMLEEHKDGLIILSACLGSELAQAWREEKMMGVVADRYKSIFNDKYFLEIQLNGEPEQTPYNEALIKLSRQQNIPLVATNDCHYLLKEHDHLQDVNFCLGMRKQLSDPVGHGPGKRHKFIPKQYSVETPDEICEAFDGIGQRDAAIRSAEIAENCKVEFNVTKVFIPNMGERSFEKEVWEGFDEKFPEGRTDEEYKERLKYELEVIKKMGYESYFLVVQEYIQAARDLGIRVGPGRGSGAGSLAAYCLGITDLDPVEYGLYFERFLNPDRVSMPDFDTDFQRSRRDELIEWVKDRYGDTSVAHIGTQSVFKAKGLVRDVARVLGYDAGRQSEFAKFIPDEDRGGQGSHRVTLSRNIQYLENGKPKMAYCHLNKEFKAKYDSDPAFQKVCDIGEHLESLRRHTSVHASGVVIHDEPLESLIPLHRPNPRTGVPVTAWDMNELEDAGFVKYDFLGLAALDVIDLAVKAIQENSPEFNIESVDLDDQDVYRNIFHEGNSYGVFQFENKGMRDFGKGFRPVSLEELSTVIALYRPGPLDMKMVEGILRIRAGKPYDPGWTADSAVADVLAGTNGVLVYQEQVLKIAQEVAGFTLAEADLMRRAIGKKKPKEMEKLRQRFQEGVIDSGRTKEFGKSAWSSIYQFSDYCLAYGTLVPTVEFGPLPIGYIVECKLPVHVYSVNAKGLVYTQPIAQWHVKGKREVYEYEFDDGSTIIATPDHKFMTADHRMLPIDIIFEEGIELLSIETPQGENDEETLSGAVAE